MSQVLRFGQVDYKNILVLVSAYNKAKEEYPKLDHQAISRLQESIQAILLDNKTVEGFNKHELGMILQLTHKYFVYHCKKAHWGMRAIIRDTCLWSSEDLQIKVLHKIEE